MLSRHLGFAMALGVALALVVGSTSRANITGITFDQQDSVVSSSSFTGTSATVAQEFNQNVVLTMDVATNSAGDYTFTDTVTNSTNTGWSDFKWLLNGSDSTFTNYALGSDSSGVTLTLNAAKTLLTLTPTGSALPSSFSINYTVSTASTSGFSVVKEDALTVPTPAGAVQLMGLAFTVLGFGLYRKRRKS